MPILNHFDLLASVYERFIPSDHPTRLLSLLDPPSHGLFLDAGGGTGRIAQFLTNSDRKIVVADLSMGMLRHATQKNGVAPVCTDTGKLPFPACFFDGIIMVDALHHVIHQKRTAAELWRVLAVGGRLVIEEPDIRTIPVKLIAVIEKLALMDSRFLAPSKIAMLFSFENSQIQTLSEGHSTWIVVKKTQPVDDHINPQAA